MKQKKRLRTGYTTGTCAAAAGRGAAMALLGTVPAAVAVDLPAGYQVRIPVRKAGREADTGWCEVVKDAGDDPDSTHGAVIRADVSLSRDASITVRGGRGVGRVTRPGLAVAPGEPAINPVPLQMIRAAVQAVLPEGAGASVRISIPDGESLARKTLNPRLGIIGGLSILGTTGIVEPYSHEAYRESISCSLDVAAAVHCTTVVLCTGKSSERIARGLYAKLPDPAFVLMADYFSYALQEVGRSGIGHVVIACFPGKLLKMAAGASSTHCRASSLNLDAFGDAACAAGVPRCRTEELKDAHTARHAMSLLEKSEQKAVCSILAARVAGRITHETAGAVHGDVAVVGYDSDVIYQTAGEGL